MVNKSRHQLTEDCVYSLTGYEPWALTVAPERLAVDSDTSSGDRCSNTQIPSK